MAFTDWLWLVRLIIEILKLLAELPKEQLIQIANLRTAFDLPGQPRKRSRRAPASSPDPPSSETT